jgi:hypothetical protein
MFAPVQDPLTSLEDIIRGLMTSKLDLFVGMGQNLFRGFATIFSCLKEPCRTAVILDAVSGLRVGELLGLKWEDVRFDQLELNVTRSVPVKSLLPARPKFHASRFP